jgi:hypothetical protein
MTEKFLYSDILTTEEKLFDYSLCRFPLTRNKHWVFVITRQDTSLTAMEWDADCFKNKPFAKREHVSSHVDLCTIYGKW